jgi:hypothetical protein
MRRWQIVWLIVMTLWSNLVFAVLIIHTALGLHILHFDRPIFPGLLWRLVTIPGVLSYVLFALLWRNDSARLPDNRAESVRRRP